MERARKPAAPPEPTPFEILPQPDDASCGPTCLHALYRFYGDPLPLERVIEEVKELETGGTLGVQLALHALRRGWRATIYTYNLLVFDPTWFEGEADLAERLSAQLQVKSDPRLQLESHAYLEFLALGGRVQFRELNTRLIRKPLKRGMPLLTGLSSTYLYGRARETGDRALTRDDVRGVPTGHFVVLYGYDREERRVQIADPLGTNPRETHHYAVGIERVIGAILLGVLTSDANLLLLRPARADTP
jgi:hypothetical protein